MEVMTVINLKLVRASEERRGEVRPGREVGREGKERDRERDGDEGQVRMRRTKGGFGEKSTLTLRRGVWNRERRGG